MTTRIGNSHPFLHFSTFAFMPYRNDSKYIKTKYQNQIYIYKTLNTPEPSVFTGISSDSVEGSYADFAAKRQAERRVYRVSKEKIFAQGSAI